MARRLVQAGLAAVALVVSAPTPSLALISHGHPEGLYVHQMAHLLFAGAMFFWIYLVKRDGLLNVPGFRALVWAGLAFILWNLVAFTGHTAEVFLSPQAFQGPSVDLSQRLLMTQPSAWVYYFTKMDHLILVPAFYFLYRGLKTLVLKSREGETG